MLGSLEGQSLTQALSLLLRIYNRGWKGLVLQKNPYINSSTLLEKNVLSDIMQTWVKAYVGVERQIQAV